MEQQSVVWIYHIVLTPLLAVATNAAVNTCVQVFAGTYVFTSLGVYPGVELLGHVVTLFLLLRNCQRVFHSG